MRLRLSDSWPSGGYSAPDVDFWARGEVREVSTEIGARLLRDFGDYFKTAKLDESAAITPGIGQHLLKKLGGFSKGGPKPALKPARKKRAPKKKA